MFIVFCSTQIEGHLFLDALKLPNPIHLLWMPVFDMLITFQRGIRWRFILKPYLKLGTLHSFELMAIAGMGNSMLPLKAGEALRAAFLAKKEKKPFNQMFSTLVVEHFFDGVGLIVILLSLAFVVELPRAMINAGLVLFTVLSVVVVLIFLVWKFQPNQEKWKYRNRFIFRVIELLDYLGQVATLLKSAKQFLAVTLITLIIWATMASSLIFIHKALGIDFTLSMMFFVLIAFTLGGAIPSGPGAVGTFEAACIIAYGYMGIPKETALSLGLYFHFLQMIPISAVGLVCYFIWNQRFKVNFKTAKELKKNARQSS